MLRHAKQNSVQPEWDLRIYGAAAVGLFSGLSLRFGLRLQIADAGFHQSPYFEINHGFWRHGHRRARARIACDALALVDGVEDSEFPEFQPVPLSQLVDDLIQELLNDLFGDVLFVPGGLSYPSDQFALSRGHGSPPLQPVEDVNSAELPVRRLAVEASHGVAQGFINGLTSMLTTDE